MALRGRLLNQPHREIHSAPMVEFLFTNPKASIIWLIVRCYVGYQWLTAGWAKVTNEAWVGGGAALKGFWTQAVAVPETGRPAIAFEWYRSGLAWMLENEWHPWFAQLVGYGELLFGVGLILGAFVGIAAFFGAFMNWNYIMAGAASTNGMLLVLSVFLILAWRIAGYLGLDHYLLPLIGTPWKRIHRNSSPPSA